MSEEKGYPKPPLPLVLIGAVFLIFVLAHFIPWQALVMIVFIALILFAFLGNLRLQVEKERAEAIPQYQPPPQPDLSPEPPPQTKPKQYQQGYQEQTPAQPTGWSPFTGFAYKGNLVKQEHPKDYYEQPQAQYPEQAPPPMA